MGSQKDKEFEKYYLKYYSIVYGYILKKVINEQTAEDLTMDTFYACWDKYDTFNENIASFQTWLFTVVNNKLKNFYRDRKDMSEPDENMACDDDSMDDVLEAIQIQYLRDHLYDALNLLSESQREIIVYKYFKNMNASDIGEHLGISPGNVRIRLKRALDRIKAYFIENNIRWE